jgi:hypothetical protein
MSFKHYKAFNRIYQKISIFGSLFVIGSKGVVNSRVILLQWNSLVK